VSAEFEPAPSGLARNLLVRTRPRSDGRRGRGDDMNDTGLSSGPASLWAVVLAAGKGSRLGPVTRVLCGRELPKQFVALTSSRTLLQETMKRIGELIPPERTVVVVSDRYAEIARIQLADYPGTEVVVQPLDRGTGPGVLLGLAHVRARDPQADVAIFPSDHHVERPGALLDAVRRGRVASQRTSAGVALLGVPAERPASDLGWIVPGERSFPEGAEVQEFVEKPAAERALRLLEAGGLWNTMVIVARLSALWRLCRKHLPAQTRDFDRYLRVIDRARAYHLLSLLYERMRPADFSRDMMQATSGLAVVPMVDSGWFDCGTPERLVAWLSSTADPAGILPRLNKTAPLAATERPHRDDGVVALA
jgi:mannose-1-phosphate guanylyltransferase